MPMVTPGSRDTTLPDRFELLEVLGRGGMGAVWLAQDAVLRRNVAIKEVQIPAGIPQAEAEAMEARVMREARAAARLNHPNVTTIFDVVRDEGRTWIVMEYVNAPTLADLVASGGPLTPQEVATIGLAILSALDAAHAAGIIHRDVKPANVMVPADGNVKLADFGIAAIQGDPKLTTTGLIVGSPSYMSPEQAQEGHVTEATDLWGLGATLYYAVEGVPAFDRGAAIPTLTAVTHEPPRPPENAGLLAPLLLNLLDKDPADRPTAGEARAVLLEVAQPSMPGDEIPGDDDVTMVAPAFEEEPAEDWRTQDSDDWGYEHDVPPRRRVWPLLLATAAVIALGILLLPRLLNGQGSESPQADDVEQRRSERANTQTEDGASEGNVSQTSVPGDWTTYDVGDTGSVVAHPADWSVVQRTATSADIVDPAGGRYLRVEYTDTPGDDAAEAWENLSVEFGANHSDYTEIAIDEYDFPGAKTAALWEYTYTEGVPLHAYDLAVVIGGRGYALNLQTHEDQWAQSQDLWDQFVAGFEPAR
jgi:serine/threonine protein kinase